MEWNISDNYRSREASEMFHIDKSAENPHFDGFLLHIIKTMDKVVRYSNLSSIKMHSDCGFKETKEPFDGKAMNKGYAANYQIIVDRVNNSDTIEVQVEMYAQSTSMPPFQMLHRRTSLC